MKDVQACLSARKDGESSFQHCGGPVSIVQAGLCAANTLQRRLDRRAGVLKNVQVYLCASSDQESSFHSCGGHVKLVQAYLCGENTLQRRFNRRRGAVKHLQACFECQKEPIKQFSPLRSYC